MKKILVVDDELAIREVVKKYLERENYNVIEAGTGVEAISKYYDEKPDLVVLDLNLPDISGEKVCESIRLNNNTPIIMITAKSNESDKLNGLILGADDYMVKPFNPKELIIRINIILKRIAENTSLANNEKRIVVNEESHTVKKDGKEIDLTPIEFKIITTLSKSPERTFTREQLISSSLGYEYEGLTRTIDCHIKNLRQKIEEDPSNPKHIKTVFGIGYKFKD